MSAPAAYENALREGVREVRWQGQTVEVEPLPWYLHYLQAARQFGVPPWELFDCWTPRAFWTQAVLLVSAAEGAAQKYREAKADHAALRD